MATLDVMPVHLTPRRLLSVAVAVAFGLASINLWDGRSGLDGTADRVVAERIATRRRVGPAPTSTVIPPVADTTTPETTAPTTTPPTTAPPPPPEPAWAPVLRAALSALGTPYRYGGTGNGGFDCSGLVQWAAAHAGIGLPRTSQAQRSATRPIGPNELQPGDLVFYYGTSHVGLYLGDGQLVHAPSSGKRVEVVPVLRGGMAPSGFGRLPAPNG